MRVLISLTVLYLGCVSGYNIDVNKAGVARGEPGTQFGYSVAIVRKPGWEKPFMIDKPFHDKLLLIGTPNRTVSNITGYGGLMRCDGPRTENISCSYIDMTEKDGICSKLKNENRSNCERDQRLGATLTINRKYKQLVNTAPSTLPMVTVCGPGWKHVYSETNTDSQNYMVGICLKLREDLDVLSCPRRNPYSDFRECWPFWPLEPYCTETPCKGQPSLAFAQAGISATYSADGLSEVIGAPGVSAWRGAYRFVQNNYQLKWNWTDTNNTLYYGYSIASASFHDDGNYIVVGAPNFHSNTQGHSGKVSIVEIVKQKDFMEFGYTKSCRDVNILKFETADIHKDQVGTKFGSVVYTVDITGDGAEEIFVAAPYYTGRRVEEGRVFVYTMQGKIVCGPIAMLSGGAKHPEFKDKVEFARFGTSIASAGDLNSDNYNDVAIGAPYEDEGRGAVYIYHGPGTCNCIMTDTFAQRIAGASIDSGLRGFGWSLYGDEDIDDNGYPDVLVGAYSSDAAVMLRARPIVRITAEIDMGPNPIPLSPLNLPCTVNGSLCFMLNVSFFLDVPSRDGGNTQQTAIQWTVDADTLYKESEGGASRVVFRDTGKSVLAENITIFTDSNNQKSYIIDVLKYKNKTEPRDAWKKIRVEGQFELVPSHLDDFDQLDPILDEETESTLASDIEFDYKCDNVEKCTSDLQTQVKMSLIGGRIGSNVQKVTDETAIYVDFADELQVETTITNLANSTYRANFTSRVNAELKWHRSSSGIVGATCKQGKAMERGPQTWLNCSADSIRLNENQNFKVTAHFDISRDSLISGNQIDTLKPSITVKVVSAQAYADSNPYNNVFEQEIPVRLKYDLEIYENATVSDEYRYKGDPNSERVFHLRHIYYIRNNGPSFLPKTYVNISVPIKMGEVIIAGIKGYPIGMCNLAGSENQVQTTKGPSVTMPTTERFTIASPESNRRRREVGDTAPAMRQTDQQVTATTKRNITCDDPTYTCQVIECLIEEFETSDKPQIEVNVDVYEKALAQEKGVLEVHFNTEAKATDPAIWFVGKVVPWNYGVSAEKTTVFVVERATLIDEIELWIIFVSIGAAVLLLIIAILILWKCGFFKRKKHQEIQKWKQESLYRRKSQRTSTMVPSNEQPYSPIESKPGTIDE